MFCHLKTVLIFTGILATSIAIKGGGAESPDVKLETQFRRPSAIEFNDDKSKLIVVNEDCGSVSLLDVATNRVVAETIMAGRLAGLATLRFDDSEHYATLDQSEHELVFFELADSKFAEKKRVKTVNSPVALACSPPGQRLAVAGLWSRQVAIHPKALNAEELSEPQFVNLGFCPGYLCWLSSDQLLVLDKFGSGVALIKCGEQQSNLQAEFRLEGRRFGGAKVSNDKEWIAISTQRLNPIGRANRNDVHWGLMIANEVIWLPVKKVLQVRGSADRFEESIWDETVIRQVGRAGDGKGDLGAIAETQDNESLVVVEGTDQLAIMRRGDLGFGYISVGRRPLSVVSNGNRGYVVNSLDDSISVVDLDSLETIKTISLGPRPDETAIRLGERLFTDASLSHDGWFSCNSCHVNGHTNGQLNDGFSDDSFDTPKRVISLLGSKDTEPYAWDGSSPDLESQIRRSISSTLQSDEPVVEEQVVAIASFINSLPAPASIIASRGNGSKLEQQAHELQFAKGKVLFAELGCAECHAGPTFTSNKILDVGLKDESGDSLFNPPSLVGLGQRDSFFHDGRTGELRKVFTKIQHQLPNPLPEEELSNLLVFLKTL